MPPDGSAPAGFQALLPARCSCTRLSGALFGFVGGLSRSDGLRNFGFAGGVALRSANSIVAPSLLIPRRNPAPWPIHWKFEAAWPRLGSKTRGVFVGESWN